MVAIVALLAVAQTVPLGPVLPAGLSETFQRVVVGIEEKLEKGDFAGAKADLRLLPKTTIRYEWDDTGVPASEKPFYLTARDKALKTWAQAAPSLKFVAAKPADLVFRFKKELPPIEGQAYIPGAVQFWSDDPKDPRLETVIGLFRSGSFLPSVKTAPGVRSAADVSDIHNEVAYAVSSYLGLGETKLSGTFTSRYDPAGVGEVRLAPAEVRLFENTRDVVKALTDAVAAKKKLRATKPKLVVEPLEVVLNDAVQGQDVRFSIQVNNLGNAPLYYRVQPDCGCLAASYDPVLPAGKSAIVQGSVNTYDFLGSLKKRFFIYSNDLEEPYREVVVKIHVAPQYRFIMPEGPTILMDDEAKTIYAYLIAAPGTKMNVKSYRLDGGVQAEVTQEPWKGELADPELQEPATMREGIRFAIKLPKNAMNGRVPGTLVAETDDARFPIMRRTFYVQKGIVALPDLLYMGNIPREPRRLNLLLSRPERDFEITKIESEHPNFTAIAKAVRGKWEYRVSVDFDGKADFGTIDTRLNIYTNDPRQPIIHVPIRAVVR